MNKYSNLTVLFLFFVLLASCNPKPRHAQIKTTKTASRDLVDNKTALPNPIKPTIKVFIENSGSMDGYVNGHTDFEYSLYKLLTDIGNRYPVTDLNVVFSSGTRSLGKDTKVINQFEPGTDRSPFRLNSDKVTGSQLEEIIRNTVKNTGPNVISILVSDFIYSNRSSSPVIAGVAIQEIFQNKLKVSKDFGIVLYKFDSGFDGKYSPECGSKVGYPINQRRPYYIWVMGASNQIAELKKIIDGAGLRGYNPNNFYMFCKSENSFNYQVLLSPKIGTYRLDKNQPKTTIVSAAIDHTATSVKKFQFSVGIDFSKYPVPENYLMDKNNYIVNPNYTIEIIKFPSSSGSSKYSHILKLSTNILKTEEVQIELKNDIPKWINESNSVDDSNVKTPNQLGKTYGYWDLVKGIYDSYAVKSLFLIKISINK